MSVSSYSPKCNSFGQKETKEELITECGYKLTAEMPDSEVVGYSNWGPNYPVPITAGQVRAQIAAKKAQAAYEAAQAEQMANNENTKESQEEYENRKKFSTEWCM